METKNLKPLSDILSDNEHNFVFMNIEPYDFSECYTPQEVCEKLTPIRDKYNKAYNFAQKYATEVMYRVGYILRYKLEDFTIEKVKEYYDKDKPVLQENFNRYKEQIDNEEKEGVKSDLEIIKTGDVIFKSEMYLLNRFLGAQYYSALKLHDSLRKKELYILSEICKIDVFKRKYGKV